MRIIVRSFGIALIIAFVLAGSVPGARAKSKSAQKGSKKLHMRVSTPLQTNGEGITTASGLIYWDIETGAGEPAVRGKIVKIRYKGWNQSGKEFANSTTLGEPSIFKLGAGQVIAGWDEGVEGMKVGGKRQLRIPPDLAYGNIGREPSVPPNSTLTYEIELIGVQ